MQTDIQYRDITRTDYLEAYLLDKIEGLAEKFMQNDKDAHLTVRVHTDRHRHDARKPVFTCEVILKPTHSKQVIKVCKTDEDFYASVSQTSEALKKILGKYSSKRAEHHKRDGDGYIYTPRTVEIEDELDIN